MNLPQIIQLSQSPPPLGYLIIGGFAVAAHGFTRPTFDVDFLVRRDQLELWRSRLSTAGFVLVSERSAFAQFSLPDSQEGLDLMLVDNRTFDLMQAGAIAADFDGTQGWVVGLDHLLSLKLHVLRQALPHRTNRDAQDVEMLLRRHQIPLDSEHYRQLFLTYGSNELYEAFQRILRHD